MPPRSNASQPLTPLELDIMNVLWDFGPGTVQMVQSRLTGRPLAYTTVQTMLNILHRKGKVERVLQDRAYVYRAVVTRPKVVRQVVSEVIERFFGGSADQLVLNLVEARQLTPETLSRLQQLIDSEEKHGKD